MYNCFVIITYYYNIINYYNILITIICNCFVTTILKIFYIDINKINGIVLYLHIDMFIR